jgi:heptosyltransferase-1
VALVLGEADADAESEFAASGGACDLLWKNLPLSALLDRLRACSGFVANDSGVAHLAAFAGLPGFVHFAVTDPRVWCPPAPGIRWGRTQRDMLAFLEEVG